MGAVLYFRATEPPDIHRGTNTNNLRGSAVGWTPKALHTAKGAAANSLTGSTVTGPTAGVEVIDTTPGEWISPPLAADVTISSSITFNLWGFESSMSANVALNAKLERLDKTGAIVSTIAQTARTTEAGTSSADEQSTVTPTSTNMLKGERFRCTVYADDAGTMATGFTFTFRAGAAGSGVDGDSNVAFVDTPTFASTTPAGTQLFLTDTAGPSVGADIEKEMWTSRGGSAVVINTSVTSNGWTAPVQLKSGGTAIEWYSKPLQAFTLAGLVRVNVRAKENGASTNGAIRVELAVCNGDGSGATVWGAADLIDSASIGLGGGAGTDALGEVTASDATVRGWLAGQDVSVTDGQRLRLRCFYDDSAGLAIVSNGGLNTVGISYNGPSASASGDSWIQLTQSVAEYVAGTTGTAVGALGALTGTVVGKVRVTGSTNQSLGALTGAALGRSTVNRGTAVGTMGALSGTVAGRVGVTGAVNAALGGLIGAVNGVPGVRGTAVATFGALTGTALGRDSNQTGVAVGSLGALSGTVVGRRGVVGSAVSVLGGAAFAATAVGKRGVLGNVSSVLGGLTGTSTGTATGAPRGTADGPLGALTGTAIGKRGVRGVTTGNLGALSGTALGRRGTAGSALGSLGGIVGTALGRTATTRGVAVGALGGLIGSVTGVPGVRGTALANLPALTGTVLGRIRVTGLAVSALGALGGTVLGRVRVTGATSGVLGGLSGAAQGRTSSLRGAALGSLGGLTGHATGIVTGDTPTGVAVALLGGLNGTAVAVVTVRGAAIGSLPALAATALGRVAVRGATTGTLGALTGGAIGRRAVTGTAGATLPALVSGAIGVRSVSGTASGPLGGLSGAASGITALLGFVILTERLVAAVRLSETASTVTLTEDVLTWAVSLAERASTAILSERLAASVTITIDPEGP